MLEGKEEALERDLEPAGCDGVPSDVPGAQLSAQEVHDSYMSRQTVEREFRQMKTGLREVGPVFVGKEGRTRGHVFASLPALKPGRELERWISAKLATPDTDPHVIALPDAQAALSRLGVPEDRIEQNIPPRAYQRGTRARKKSWRRWSYVCPGSSLQTEACPPGQPATGVTSGKWRHKPAPGSREDPSKVLITRRAAAWRWLKASLATVVPKSWRIRRRRRGRNQNPRSAPV